MTDELPLPGQTAAKALVVTEAGRSAPVTHLLRRGNPGSPGEAVEPGFLSVLGAAIPSVTPPASGRSSGRRRALADWIAAPDNPLTARVIVNRVFQHHFGRGLVRTPSDFGVQEVFLPTPNCSIGWLRSSFRMGGASSGCIG